ncbi:ATP-binding protein [Paenibacillus harenae]|uniref:ATP-binding protein n=1 Tax=Paenibacillus harenae TaxID=306543 RepID=UPI0004116EE4|nr:HAMP domain-containing sensor histidine kinase [Paenibacillus harenae]
MKQAMEFLFNSDKVDIGIAVLDPETRVLFANKKTKQCYPVMIGELFPSHTNLSRVITETLQKNIVTNGLPVQENIDGQVYQLSIYLFPMQKNETITSIVLIICDHTSLQQFYESKGVHENFSLIGQMAAETANVILNPLAVIKGTLQLMEQNIKANSIFIDLLTPLHQKLNEYFHLLYSQVQTVDDILRRFLFLGKASDITLTPILVFPLFQELISSVQHLAIERNIRLVCEFPSQHGYVLGNKVYLREAILALLHNSFEATEGGGIVTLSAEITIETVRFIVKDQGEGIHPDILSQVKNPFFTTKDDALGFGLSLCDQTVRKLGGTLNISSGSNGTEVQVCLPNINLYSSNP